MEFARDDAPDPFYLRLSDNGTPRRLQIVVIIFELVAQVKFSSLPPPGDDNGIGNVPVVRRFARQPTRVYL